jgi:hypothetical protein
MEQQDYTLRKLEIELDFADDVYKAYRAEKYGMGNCCGSDLADNVVRKSLCDWQDNRTLTYTIKSITPELYSPPVDGTAVDDTDAPSWVNLECGWTGCFGYDPPDPDNKCNNSECILIQAVTDTGLPVPNYDITVDGISQGVTNDLGELRFCIADASNETNHKLQLCECLTTTGNCDQQRITIVLACK